MSSPCFPPGGGVCGAGMGSAAISVMVGPQGSSQDQGSDTLNMHIQRGRSFPAPAAGQALPAMVGEQQSKAGDSPVPSQLLSQRVTRHLMSGKGMGGKVHCQRLHSKPWIELEASPALLAAIPYVPLIPLHSQAAGPAPLSKAMCSGGGTEGLVPTMVPSSSTAQPVGLSSSLLGAACRKSPCSQLVPPPAFWVLCIQHCGLAVMLRLLPHLWEHRTGDTHLFV